MPRQCNNNKYENYTPVALLPRFNRKGDFTDVSWLRNEAEGVNSRTVFVLIRKGQRHRHHLSVRALAAARRLGSQRRSVPMLGTQVGDTEAVHLSKCLEPERERLSKGFVVPVPGTGVLCQDIQAP